MLNQEMYKELLVYPQRYLANNNYAVQDSYARQYQVSLTLNYQSKASQAFTVDGLIEEISDNTILVPGKGKMIERNTLFGILKKHGLMR